MPEDRPSPRARAALAISRAAAEVLDTGDIDLAERLGRLALETDSSPANLHSVMAGILESRGDRPGAMAFWQSAVAAAPASPGHRFNLSLALMREGHMSEGLALQEARYGREKWTSIAAQGSLAGLMHRLPRPGDDLAGKRVLVFTEQGLGDCVWAARWLPALAARGPRLSLAVRPALRPLLASCAAFEAVLSPPDDTEQSKLNLAALAGRFDHFLPLMSLPWLLGITEAGPAETPWLQPDPAKVAAWRTRFAKALPERAPIVGLVWRANRENASGERRSLPAAALRLLARHPGIGFVALQGGERQERHLAAQALPGLFDALAEGEAPLDQLAAAIAATDLLVSVDTLAMHLAGSMGHPTLTPLAQSAPGFLPGPLADNCAWYRSVTLVRQQSGEDWDPVMQRVAARL